MSRPVERELKLDVDPGFRLPDITSVPSLSVVTRPGKTLDAAYYDTRTLDLARWGATLRYRATVGGDGEWTVKLNTSPQTHGRPEGGETTDRYEVNLPGRAGRPPKAALDLTTGLRRGRPVTTVARLRTVRRVHVVLDANGNELAELDDDTVEWSTVPGPAEPTREGTFREVEIELLQDPERGTKRGKVQKALYRLLTDAGAEAGDGRPKLMRALVTVPPPLRRSPGIGARATASDLVSATVESGLWRLLAHQGGVQVGDDPEDVHQCRVATRRLRSDLATLAPLLLPGAADAVTAGLKSLAGHLGAARDADVLGDRLRKLGPRLGPADHREVEALIDLLGQQGARARRSLLHEVSSAAHGRLVDRLFRLMEAPPLLDPDQPAPEAVLPLVRSRWRSWRGAVGRLGDDPTDDDLHAVRKKAKRCRYAADMAAPVLGKRAARLAASAGTVQEILGTLQDTVVAGAWLRSQAQEGPGGRALVAGRLVEIESERAAEARRRWVEAWSDVHVSKVERWLTPSS